MALVFLSMLPSPAIAVEEPEEGPVNEDGILPPIAILDIINYGSIKISLYLNWTPITVNNFIGLAESGHYNGVLFHRIVDDFVIQTGDGGGSSTIPLELHPNATHIDGAVGMARESDPDTAADQFYICDGPQHGLDDASINPEEGQSPGYAVFGVVIEGMEVVRAIASVPVYGENNPRPGSVVPSLWYNVGTPKQDVILEKVTIEYPEEEIEVGEEDDFILSGASLNAALIGLVLIVPAAALANFYFKRKRLIEDALLLEIEEG